jgi:hypothetical protein
MTEAENLLARRKSVQECEQYVRSTFGAHLVIPGRNQGGPLAIVGRTWREALPATAHVLQQLDWTAVLTGNENDTPISASRNGGDPTSSSSCGPEALMALPGRIQRDVKDPQDPILSGVFQPDPATLAATPNSSTSLRPWWLFQSAAWNVLACRWTSLPETETQQRRVSSSSLSSLSSLTTNTEMSLLQTCVDNMRFRLGNNYLNDLDMFVCDKISGQATAYAGGNPTPATVLFQEIMQGLTAESSATTAEQSQQQRQDS